MAWRWMTAAAVIMMYYGAAVVAEESRKDINLQLEPLGVNLRDRAFSRQPGAGQEWEDSRFADELQINHDYFAHPILETTHQLPPAVGQTFISKELHNDSSLESISIKDIDTTDKSLDVRKQEGLQHDKIHLSVKQSNTGLYQEEQIWPNKDPFSVFYDSMFPEMESVIPEEETYTKNIPTVPPTPVKQRTPNPTKPISPLQASAQSSPVTSFMDLQLPTMAPEQLSSSMLNTLSSPAPSLLNTSFDYKEFEKLVMRMSLVLEKFGLPKSFTKKVFKEEEKFLSSLIHVKSLRDKLNTISHHKLSSVTSKLNISHLLSKFGLKNALKNITSKLDLEDVALKMGVPDMAFKVNLTDLISKLDIDNIAYIVDLVEAASNLSLKDVTSKMNIGHLNSARLQQITVILSHILAHITHLESVQRATKMLGINGTFMDGVLDSVESSARYVSDDDNGRRLLLLPLFDDVSLNVVQSLGFTVLLFFLLLSAYSYITLKADTIDKEGSQEPHMFAPSEWDQDWKATVDATEAFDLPLKHNRNHKEDQGHRDPVISTRPMPVPDPGVLHKMGHQLSSQLKTHLQHTKTHRGPLIVPVVNLHGGYHKNPHLVNKHHASDLQPTVEKPLHHFSLLQPPHQPFLQHSVPPFAETDHYDKHRHFASYEDDYQYEGKDEHVGNYFLNNNNQRHHGSHSEAESTRTPENHRYSNPTSRPTDTGNFNTYNQAPSLWTTWQSRRSTSQPSSYPSTTQPSTTINSVPNHTYLPNSRIRPTSKYAQRVTPSLKTRRTNFTSG